MSWLALLLPLLEFFLKWLNNRQTLTTAQQKRVNHFLAKCNQCKTKAVPMGCKPEGELDNTQNTSPEDNDWE